MRHAPAAAGVPPGEAASVDEPLDGAGAAAAVLARRGAEEPLGAEVDPRSRALDRRAAVRRATLLVLTLVALALTARAIVGERGLLDARRSLSELTRAQGEVEKWRQRNAWLEARIAALRQDPATIESLARERLDYVRPGEITFLLPDDPGAPAPGEPAPVAPGEFSPVLP